VPALLADQRRSCRYARENTEAGALICNITRCKAEFGQRDEFGPWSDVRRRVPVRV